MKRFLEAFGWLVVGVVLLASLVVFASVGCSKNEPAVAPVLEGLDASDKSYNVLRMYHDLAASTRIAQTSDGHAPWCMWFATGRCTCAGWDGRMPGDTTSVVGPPLRQPFPGAVPFVNLPFGGYRGWQY